MAELSFPLCTLRWVSLRGFIISLATEREDAPILTPSMPRLVREAAFSNVIAALSGTNLVHDNAYLGAGLLGSLEMILMNSDIIGYVKRLQQGIEVSDESLCVDLIDKVGPGGQFMTEMHTFSNYKRKPIIRSL